jgi:hypothetical protein
MSTFILKRKTYSDENGGMSTGKKIALGTAGTIGAGALAFGAAKGGFMGNNMMLKANKAWGNTGVRLSNLGATRMGHSMIESGAKGVGKAKGNILADKLANNNVSKDIITTRQNKLQGNAEMRQLNQWMNKLEPVNK